MGELTDLLPIVLVALLLWLSGLSLAFWKLFTHYRRVIGKAHGGDLVSAIDSLIGAEERNAEGIRKLKEKLDLVVEWASSPIQKVGLVRFNPFEETGGAQSFSLCLLDGNDSGFILTALHTRDRTRVYTKSIENGKSKHELSHEESRALKEAQKNEKIL